MSAAKMVQDNADRTTGPLIDHLAALALAETHFGENPGSIARFYGLIHSIYAHTDRSPSQRYARLWAGVGLERELIDKLLDAYAELLADEGLAGQIAGSMTPRLAQV